MNHHICLIFCLLLTADASFAQTWTQKATTNDPPPRRNASAVYDPVGDRIILFGGMSASGNLNDIWSLSLITRAWTQINPVNDTMPAARFSHNAVFDSANYRMLVWSGQGSGLFNDVWAFDLAANRWTELWHNGNVNGAPLIRYGTAAVFDPLQKRLINFAGFTSSGRFEDTWYFKTDSLNWTDRTIDPHPPRRCLHTSCFVNNRRLMVVYGGQSTGPLDDLWALQVDAFTWSELQAASRPVARYFSSCVSDGQDNVFIFGGQTNNGPANDLWRFSLVDLGWHSVPPGTSQPSARYGHTAVYVAARNAIIIFGGAGSTLFDDTWEYVFTPAGVGEEKTNPSTFALEQNYPNPFNPFTTIRFVVGGTGHTSLRVFNLLGQEVVTLVNGELNAGSYETRLDASGLSSGVYLYRLQAGEFTQTKRLLLLR